MKTCLGFILLVIAIIGVATTLIYQWQSQANIEFERAETLSAPSTPQSK